MKIQDILTRRAILIDLKADDKTGLLTQMARYLASVHDLKNADTIVQKLLDREAQMSTGIGYGIAIPHARLDSIDKVHMVAARCEKEIEFGAIDDQPVRIVFMMISPTNTATELTTLLSSLSKIMSYEEIRDKLIAASGPDEFLQMLVEGENKYVS